MTMPTGALQPDAVRLFFSYAHEDEQLFARVIAHLSPLRREMAIDEWHYRIAVPDVKLEREIKNHLESADIILLLISADFFNSDRC